MRVVVRGDARNKIWRPVVLAASSGIMLALSFPAPDVGVLAWVALVPLFWACQHEGPKRAFWWGWVTGAAFFAVVIYWIPSTISTYTNLSPILSLGPYLLLVTVMACYTGAFAAGCKAASVHGWSLALAAPALWVSLEWLRSLLLGGFPWAGLGYTQHRFDLLVQVAEITGYYGVSGLVVLGNVACFEAIKGRGSGRGSRFRTLAFFSACVVLAVFFGWWRLRRLAVIPPDHEIKIAVAQGNIDQFHKWDPAYQGRTLKRYAELTRAASEQGASLVVWPETAVPFYFQEDSVLRDQVLNLAREAGVYILLGSPAFQYLQDGSGIAHFNRAYLVTASGEISGHYDKLRLVPFGEYVPLQRLLFFVDKMVEGVGNFAPGNEAVVLHMPKLSFGVLICYEDIFPALARRFTGGPGLIERLLLGRGGPGGGKGGADLLINITNDAWFGKTAAPYQHLVMGTMRAVENRVPLVRVANTGVSAIVEPSGKIRWHSRLFETVLRVATVRWASVDTFYERFGDIFAYVEILLAALTLSLPVPGRRGAIGGWR